MIGSIMLAERLTRGESCEDWIEDGLDLTKRPIPPLKGPFSSLFLLSRHRSLFSLPIVV